MSKTLVWKQLVGQNRVKETLSTAFMNGSLGHAYLFSGPAGMGKFQVALELARALLCTNENNVPCYTCESCRQIDSFSHPDFHCVFPIALDKEHKVSGENTKLSDSGWQFVGDETRKKIKNPYLLTETRLLRIPVDWIRELNHSIMRGTIQGKTNVAIICDVDVMQAGSANAMLKTLEEPPANTLMILLTQRPHTVLPTIRSRCQIIRFGSIAEDVLIRALSEECSLDADDAKVKHAVNNASGSYGKALSLVEESLDVFAEQAIHLWQLCAKKVPLNTMIERVEQVTEEYLGDGYDYAAGEKLLTSFLHIIRTTFFQGIPEKGKYINGIDTDNAGIHVEVEMADQLFTSCEKAISAVRARGNVLLILITFLMSVSEILHGKE